MQVKIFYEDMTRRDQLEKELNNFLKGLPKADIVQIDTLAFSATPKTEHARSTPDFAAVFVWLRADAKEEKKE